MVTFNPFFNPRPYLLGVGKVIGSMRGQSHDITKDVKSCTYCCYVRWTTLIVWVGGMPRPQTGATQYHEQLRLPDKGRAIKGLVVCNNWDLEPLDLLNGLALGCYQLSPEVLIISIFLIYLYCCTLIIMSMSDTLRLKITNFIIT